MPVPDWRQLPSLSSLRAYEATARLGGFSAAARALNVTHAAVAQQVRGLESELGQALVLRDGRGLALTPEGRQLAASLGEGFSTIAAGIEALRSSERARGIRVSTSPNFAQAVLMPRLGEFWAAHPAVPVSLVPDFRAVDLAREGFDLAIRTGSGDWPGISAELLARNRYLAVGAPSLLGEGEPDLAALPWLLDPQDPNDFRWLRAAGLDPEALTVIAMDGSISITGAVHGYGLTFATDAIVRQHIAAGRLRAVEFPGLPMISYYIVTLPGPRRPAVQAFIDWLRTLVRA